MIGFALLIVLSVPLLILYYVLVGALLGNGWATVILVVLVASTVVELTRTSSQANRRG